VFKNKKSLCSFSLSQFIVLLFVAAVTYVNGSHVHLAAPSFVAAQSSQVFARNFNGIVPAAVVPAAAAVVPAPAAVPLLPSRVVAPYAPYLNYPYNPYYTNHYHSYIRPVYY
jgi:hypothetical protein